MSGSGTLQGLASSVRRAKAEKMWLGKHFASARVHCPLVWTDHNSLDYKEIFDYLTLKMKHILSLYLFAEISILGDFSVHHQLWFSPPFIELLGELDFNFAIFHDLD
ncbi:hypothetical protein E2C01_025366 [Portunus trituberculatus]|uniref:Uncharacterized protein n=1 Tax=Portunus trituberculatus TaxID=210409 RepID=A0A5B7EG97_PORTR|nr:hypothetical protein [Portunus trituberculatus]